MAQYIPKSAVVAEIVRRRKEIPKNETDKALRAVYGNEAFVLTELLSFLDTLEVKEVDLDKEIKNEIDEYWYDNDYGAIQRHGGTVTMEISDVKEIARHFFELGLKAQKEE